MALEEHRLCSKMKIASGQEALLDDPCPSTQRGPPDAVGPNMAQEHMKDPLGKFPSQDAETKPVEAREGFRSKKGPEDESGAPVAAILSQAFL